MGQSTRPGKLMYVIAYTEPNVHVQEGITSNELYREGNPEPALKAIQMNWNLASTAEYKVQEAG